MNAIPPTLVNSMWVASFAFVATVWLAIHLANRDWRVSLKVATGLIVWYGLVLGLGKFGFFGFSVIRIPMIAGTFVALFFFGRWLYRRTALQKIIGMVPVRWLIGVQIFRVMGYGFLSFFNLGLIPGVFAIPTAYGDMAIGATAPLVAYLATKPKMNPLVTWWNYLGIADMCLALGLGMLTYPRPLQILSAEPSNDLIALFPLVLVPLFAVPLSMLLHIFTLRQLKAAG